MICAVMKTKPILAQINPRILMMDGEIMTMVLAIKQIAIPIMMLSTIMMMMMTGASSSQLDPSLLS